MFGSIQKIIGLFDMVTDFLHFVYHVISFLDP